MSNVNSRVHTTLCVLKHKIKVVYQGLIYETDISETISHYLFGGFKMEEELVHIEIVFEEKTEKYKATVQSDLGGLREYNAKSINELLRTLTIELQEEFDNVVLDQAP